MGLLHIDTSADWATVCLSDRGECIHQYKSKEALRHHCELPIMIEKALNLKYPIQAIHINIGPGSYTGLRIGMSIVKGLAMGMSVPIVASNSMEILFSTAANALNHGTECIVCLLARKTELYFQRFNYIGPQSNVSSIEAQELIDSIDHNKELICITDEKAFPLLEGQLLRIERRNIEAYDMISIGTKKYNDKSYSDINALQPLYMKPVRIISSKKKLFG